MPLADALAEPRQFAILAGAVLILFPLRRGAVPTLPAAAAAGVIVLALVALLP